MNRYSIVIILAVVTVIGCGGSPRYRAGGSEKRQVVSAKSKLTSKDYIRFGNICTQYLGRPYKGTSSYDPGLDCSRFTREVFKKFNGTILPVTAADQFGAGKKVVHRKLAYADLVFFKTVGNKISHVGIYLQGRQFIHVSSSRGVIISSMDEKYWSKRYAGVRRILH